MGNILRSKQNFGKVPIYRLVNQTSWKKILHNLFNHFPTWDPIPSNLFVESLRYEVVDPGNLEYQNVKNLNFGDLLPNKQCMADHYPISTQITSRNKNSYKISGWRSSLQKKKLFAYNISPNQHLSNLLETASEMIGGLCKEKIVTFRKKKEFKCPIYTTIYHLLNCSVHEFISFLLSSYNKDNIFFEGSDEQNNVKNSENILACSELMSPTPTLQDIQDLSDIQNFPETNQENQDIQEILDIEKKQNTNNYKTLVKLYVKYFIQYSESNTKIILSKQNPTNIVNWWAAGMSQLFVMISNLIIANSILATHNSNNLNHIIKFHKGLSIFSKQQRQKQILDMLQKQDIISLIDSNWIFDDDDFVLKCIVDHSLHMSANSKNILLLRKERFAECQNCDCSTNEWEEFLCVTARDKISNDTILIGTGYGNYKQSYGKDLRLLASQKNIKDLFLILNLDTDNAQKQSFFLSSLDFCQIYPPNESIIPFNSESNRPVPTMFTKCLYTQLDFSRAGIVNVTKDFIIHILINNQSNIKNNLNDSLKAKKYKRQSCIV